MNVRTRMAPSPTGEFHIGGMRTYLYNYAWAKKNNGQMVLRIEDTDKKREVEGALDRILSVIKAFGLTWDEGPIVQSDRLELYGEYAKKLIESGHAYYCFCTPERLKEMREEQQSKGAPVTRYDKKCLQLSKEEVSEKLASGIDYVIRLKVPENETLSWNDLVVGKVSIDSNEIDDQVLMKSDGFPTYHLAVVVDDHMMEINPVIRGNEWLPSTPKQIILYKAFGWEVPDFCHLPNLKELGSNKKMSKRFGDVHAIKFLESGYLPEALLNFLMFLGWNPGTDKEIYSLEEFINDFDLKKIHKTDLVVFDREKLLWMNGNYIRNLSVEELFQRIKEWAESFSDALDFLSGDDKKDLKILSLVHERMKVLSEYADLVGYFYSDPEPANELITKYAKDKTQKILEDFISLYEGVSAGDWNVAELDKLSHDLLESGGYKPKEAFMTVRVGVSSREATPPLFEMLEALGKETTLNRLRKYLV